MTRRQRRGSVLAAVALGAGCAASAALFLALPNMPGGSSVKRFASVERTAALALSASTVTDYAVDAKAKLLDLLADDVIASEVLKPEGKPTRGKVDEAIIQLERQNAEAEPVYSPKLDGAWKVKYTGTYAPGLLSSPTRELALFLYGGGFSLGNALSSFAGGFWGSTLGLKVTSKQVFVKSGRDVTSIAKVELFGVKETLKYSAELMPLSSVRMSEEIVSLELPTVGKQDLPFELRRNILVTYLDEDVLVVRDESGVPEVLVRDTEAQSEEITAIDATSSSTDDALITTMSSEAA